MIKLTKSHFAFQAEYVDATQLVRVAKPPLWCKSLEPIRCEDRVQFEADDADQTLKFVIVSRLLARWGFKAIDNDLPDFAKSLASALTQDQRKARVKQLDLLPAATLGSLSPKYLFLGERTSGWDKWHSDGYRRLPFVGLNHSSSFLYKLFESAGITEDQVHLGNSMDEFGTQFPLVDFLSILPEIKIVVLMGNKAQKNLRGVLPHSGIKVVNFHHPSYIKRFYYHRIDEWGTKLHKLVDC